MLIGVGIFFIVLYIVVAILVEVFHLAFSLSVDLVELGIAFVIIGAVVEVILSLLGRPSSFRYFRGRR